MKTHTHHYTETVEWLSGRNGERRYTATVVIKAWISRGDNGRWWVDDWQPTRYVVVLEERVADCWIERPLDGISGMVAGDAAYELLARKYEDADADEALQQRILADWAADQEARRDEAADHRRRSKMEDAL